MIGLYDSGMGGITVLAPLLKRLPQIDYLYLADYQYAPLGNKDETVLKQIVTKRVSFLIEHGCQMIVLACNTASTFADDLRKKFQVPIIAIQPAIKMVYDAKKFKKMIVLATPQTLKSSKTRNLIEQYQIETFQLCPSLQLASLIEEGNAKKIKKELETLLSCYKQEKELALVLGCTHYPLIQKEIKKILPHATLFEGGKGTAMRAASIFEEKKMPSKKQEGTVTFFFTDHIDRTKKFKKQLKAYQKSLKL